MALFTARWANWAEMGQQPQVRKPELQQGPEKEVKSGCNLPIIFGVKLTPQLQYFDISENIIILFLSEFCTVYNNNP